MSSIVHVITYAGPPTLAPVAVGQHWVDTLNKETYLSVGTSTVNDWQISNVNTSPIADDAVAMAIAL